MPVRGVVWFADTSKEIARNVIQFLTGLSLREFLRCYGTEEQCEAALEKARWPDGFRCSRCDGHEHGLVYGRRLKRYQCRTCGHQATLTAGTIMPETKLPLTTWFQAFYLIGEAKTGISSLEPSRHLGVKYDMAWLLHNKILRAMSDRDDVYMLRGKIHMVDAYLGGERPGGKAGRGSENKIPSLQPFPSMRQATQSTPKSLRGWLQFRGDRYLGQRSPGSRQCRSLRWPGLLSLGHRGRLQLRGHRHRWQTPEQSSAVSLDQHCSGEPQNEPQRHCPRLQL
jgi:hypothetical protein